MPYDTTITFVPRDNNKPVRNFTTSAYPLSPRFRGKRIHPKCDIVKHCGLHFREHGNSSYVDFVATITQEEFLRFHKKHYHKPFHPEKDFHAFLKKEMHETYYRWVIIDCSEWESGLC